ncbi:MAG: hypothetical protein MI754_05565 [Chromatiales bacterium]|nr:hypothetical protein [Chromatiales bacterium]
MKRLAEVTQQYPFLGVPRGKGFMIGIPVLTANTPSIPDGLMAKRLQQALFKRGVICECGGIDDSVIRLLPAHNIPWDLLLWFVDTLDGVAASINEEHK